MDLFESTKMVFHRVEKVDPENVYSIINHLLISDHNELQMIRLAFSPDPMLQDMINKVKLDIVSSPPVLQQPLVSNHPLSFTPPSCYAPQNSLLIPQMPLTWLDSGAFYPAPAMQPVMLDFIPPFRLFEMGLKPCSSFSQGFCKHGGSCGFLHILQLQNGDCMVLNPPSILSSGFLKQLEFEVVELLGSKPGIPVSVSSLPILYFDYFGKVLQIEKKLTFRVSQLLARISTYIRLTSRPHGRPSMLLVDDVDRFSGFGEAKGHELAVYLTFPTEGNFNEKDVHIYFKNFGPVQQVRIPGQVRRMFGFVTFVYPETVALVLSKRYPHYICGADVLVKPYQLRPGLVDRTTEEESSNEPAVDLPSSDGVVHGSSE